MNSIVLAVLMAAAVTQPPKTTLIQHDPFSRAVEVFRLTFEADQDREFDGQPDDWTRRKGALFPTYVRSEIDRDHAQHGRQSLRFDVNGGRAIYYSPPQRIDSLHAYVFEGYIRTQNLKNDAAMISLSFLNHRRQRVQRVLGKPVSGTHNGWVRVRVGPIVPKSDVWFVVVGCHIVPGEKMDLSGQVWFDNLWLGRLPQLALVSNYETHFKVPRAPILTTAHVGGLDTGASYRLRMQMFDSNARLINEKTQPLSPQRRSEDEIAENIAQKPIAVPWQQPAQPRGYYRIRAALERDGEVIIEKFTAFIVMDLVESAKEGEFGWSIATGAGKTPLKDLADIAAQSGINWLKYPLWQTVKQDKPNRPADVAELFDVLSHRRITPIGLLNDPPADLRRKFANEWTGVSEIFTMPPKFWWGDVEPVIARYSSSVRHWQLGGEADPSFRDLKSLPETVQALKKEFDTIGRDTRVGIPWDWNTPLPNRDRLPHAFFSIHNQKTLNDEELATALHKSRASGLPRWVVIQPLSASKHTAEQRGSDLVKRLAVAKAGGAEAIFAADVFDPDHGLLQSNGAPSLLFLPWRTTALALQGANFIGSLKLGNGSKNYVFSRDGEGIIILWNEKQTHEELYFGENVETTDIWGRRTEVANLPGSKRQSINVGPVPIILRGCSEPILRWRMATRFEVPQLQSRHGGQAQKIISENTFTQGVNGTITLNVPRGWTVQPKTWTIRAAAGESLQMPMSLVVPANASLGDVPVTIDVAVTADRPYRFQIHRSFKIGMGDIAMQIFDRKTKDGRLEIEQVITNNTKPIEVLGFRCSLFAPGHRRQGRTVTKLGKGKDRKFYYLPNAESLRGKTLWIRAEQIDGNRVLNFRWKALENEEANKLRKKNSGKPNGNGPTGSSPKSASTRPKPQATSDRSDHYQSFSVALSDGLGLDGIDRVPHGRFS